jgi:DNA-binding MarR family transcriptional regulator
LQKQVSEREEHIGLLVAAARRRIKQTVGVRVRRYQLTPQQFWVLVAIHESTGLSLRQLAERLRMDEPTASRVVSTLIRRKLARVESHPLDRRRSCLHLGIAGAAMANELGTIAGEVRSALVDGLSVAERSALRSSLRKVIANMERLVLDEGTSIAARRG